MPRVGRHVRVSGLVQGVWFRAWAAEQAKALGVSGWVRNCVDGSVEAHLSGEPAAVARMIELLHKGPPAARVSEVRVEEVAPEKPTDFQVRH